MSNIFNGFNIGLRALQTQKKSIDITGHNIANASNENYTRQRAIHTASDPYPVPGFQSPGGAGQMGTGVEIEKIERIKDAFINRQINEESQEQGYWNKLHQGLERIEFTYNEPSDSGLAAAFNAFWNSLQDLSNRPEDTATRTAVKNRGIVLVNSFNTVYEQLMDYKRSLNTDLNSTVNNINSLARRIADLNKQITSVMSGNQTPNDLLDKRESLYNKLNRLINVQGRIDNTGGLNISIGGVKIVSGSDIFELAVENNSNEDRIVFTDTGEEIKFKSGTLQAIIDIRDREINKNIGRLDKLAETLTNKFNEVHSLGYDLDGEQNNNFFKNLNGNTEHASAAIDLCSKIKAEDGIRKIAAGNYSDSPDITTAWNEGADIESSYYIKVTEGTAADFDYKIYKNNGNTPLYSGSINRGQEIDLSTGEGMKLLLYKTGEASINFSGNKGSGTNGISLSGVIKTDKVLEGTSLSDYYQAVISTIGINTQRAEQMVNNQEALLDQLKSIKKSVSGVSLDEEMANLIKYQQAYNAAAKMISKTEEIIDNLMTIIR